jgi:geranylgeranylglycerol-phosphate geranylgeranyltransferase
MKAFTGCIRIMRPGNMAVCAFSVLTGGLLSGKPFEMFRDAVVASVSGASPRWFLNVLFAAVSAALVLAAGNIHNDIRDFVSDRVNTPGRPIPSGAVGRTTAYLLAGVLAVAGLLLSIPLGSAGIGIAVGAVALLFIYNMRLKGVPLAGNLAVALLGGIAFVYGGVAAGNAGPSAIPALFAVLFHLGREIVKDAADVRGDREAGVRTIATAWGVAPASWSAAVVFILLGAVVSLPYAYGVFGLVYFLLVAVGIWPVLAWAASSTVVHPYESNFRKIAFVLKLDMIVGVIAVLVGFQGW